MKTTHTLLLLSCGWGFLSGCTDRIAGAQCEPADFQVAEVRADTVVTTTGLRWIEGTPGIGPALAWCQPVALHYDAYLLDGDRFDSSRDEGRPLLFVPGYSALIDGFEQGVIGLRAGGTRRVIIPPQLGYGAEGLRDPGGQIVVPANSTLVFDLELIEIGS